MLHASYTMIFLLCSPIGDGPQKCDQVWQESGYHHRFECSYQGKIAKSEFNSERAKHDRRVVKTLCTWQASDPNAKAVSLTEHQSSK